MLQRFHWSKLLIIFLLFNSASIGAELSAGETFDKSNADSSWYKFTDNMKGKVFKAGDMMKIRWESGGPKITGAIVSLSTDGVIWVEINPDGIIPPNAPDWGKVDWMVQETFFADGHGFVSMVGNAVRARIIDFQNPNILSYSEHFTIQGPDPIQPGNQNPLDRNFEIELGSQGLYFKNPIETSVQISVFGLLGNRVGEFQIFKGENPHIKFKNPLPGGIYSISIQIGSRPYFTNKTLIK